MSDHRKKQKDDSTQYFFVQSSTDNGYMLFPHQDLAKDSLRLPPYCITNGHPTKNAETWDALSKNPETFRTGDRVLLYQSGKPIWLSGFWGYGTIRKWGNRVSIITDRLLSTPLILDKPTRKVIRKPFLKSLLRAKRRRGSSYRSTYAEISYDEFEGFVQLMKRRESVNPIKARSRTAEGISKRKATEAFRKWAVNKGWSIFGPAGYPDLLAEFPNGRIAAFEAKLYPEEDLRDSQREMFPILRKIGLSITTLNNVRNSEAGSEVRRNHWKVIAKGEGRNTKGWPDFVLKKHGKVVAIELKTGEWEPVSLMQVETLSALSSQMDMEVHVVRAIWEERAWKLYDDSERWLLYPPRTG